MIRNNSLIYSQFFVSMTFENLNQDIESFTVVIYAKYISYSIVLIYIYREEVMVDCTLPHLRDSDEARIAYKSLELLRFGRNFLFCSGPLVSVFWVENSFACSLCSLLFPSSLCFVWAYSMSYSLL